MKSPARCLGLAAVAAFILASNPVLAQKSGGVLKIQHMDTPPSASIHEEATFSAVMPFMALYNNLVIFDQHVARNSLESVVPDLATSWTWSVDGKALSFKLRQGVKWHDGKPFTAKDVACTFDLLIDPEKLRRNPRSAWWGNLEKVTVESDFDVTIHLKRRQPALLALFASGYTPIYPCHIPIADMRRKPIGTGPFKLAEFKMNESIKLVKNPDYWKPGLPYLDGIEYTIIADRSTRMLSFISGKFDMTLPARCDGSAAQDHPQGCAECPVHHAQHRRRRQRHDQSREAAVRRSEDPPRHGAEPGSQGVHGHPQRGAGADERRHAAAARRPVGADAGHAEIDRRLWRRRQGARGGSRPDEAGRLRAGQAAQDQGQHAQHRRVPRPGGDPDRPAEADLDRGGARDHRHRGLLQPRLQEGLLRGDELQRQRRRRSRRHASSKAMPAARCATTTATAIPR